MCSEKHLWGVNSRKKEVKFVIHFILALKFNTIKKIQPFFYTKNNYLKIILKGLFLLKTHEQITLKQKLHIDAELKVQYDLLLKWQIQDSFPYAI